MTRIGYGSIFFSLEFLGPAVASSVLAPPGRAAGTGAPALRPQGTTKQLVVDGRPFLMLGGELGNSTASSAASLDAVWPKLQALHLNTVLVAGLLGADRARSRASSISRRSTG